MLAELKPAAVMLFALTLLTGLGYPWAVSALAQAFFPDQANGSLIVIGDRAVGSRLIGQPFGDPRYFWGRLSATTPTPYNAGASTGSNLGPLNPALKEAVQARIGALRAADPSNTAPLPVDLVTASGSGLDPHISLAAADYQLRRVAGARGLELAAVERVVSDHTSPRTLGLLGEPTVNVLEVNLALDALKSPPAAAPR
jgi:K+-transporting ATPase ATPase C chain